jgi:ornithine cyclodeaminase/alanine dehydrogenase-like protein (mu-crystallin family)
VIDSSRGVTHADETEDMRKAVRAALKEHDLPNLHDLVLGRAEGRTAPEQVSCFLNYVGLGYQFAAVGSLLHRKARELGIGRELPTDWFTEDVNP